MKLLFTLLILCFVLNAQAIQSLRLFSNGHFILNYDTTVGKIGPNDILEFDDGHSYQVVEKLGVGTTARVFKVTPYPNTGEFYALRIPLQSGYYGPRLMGMKSTPMAEFINMTVTSYEQLKDSNISIPKLHRSLKSQYALMEFIQVDFSLVDLLRTPNKIPLELLQRSMEALKPFAKAVAPWKALGDFKLNNIIYSDQLQSWVFIDQLPYNQKLPASASRGDLLETPFDGHKWPFAGDQWAQKVLGILISEVQANRCNKALEQF